MATPVNLCCCFKSRACFSATGNFLTPSTPVSPDTCCLVCAMIIVHASKCNLLTLALSLRVMSTPPFTELQKASNSAAVGGVCGVPTANASSEKLCKPFVLRMFFSHPLPSTRSQWDSNAAFESTKAMASTVDLLSLVFQNTQFLPKIG